MEASRLARWDGTAWSPVDGGVSDSRPGSLASVRALASDGARASTSPARSTRWAPSPRTGSPALDLATGAWQTYDGGLWSGPDPGEGHALAPAGERV